MCVCVCVILFNELCRSDCFDTKMLLMLGHFSLVTADSFTREIWHDSITPYPLLIFLMCIIIIQQEILRYLGFFKNTIYSISVLLTIDNIFPYMVIVVYYY